MRKTIDPQVYADIYTVKGSTACYNKIKEDHPEWTHIEVSSVYFQAKELVDKENIQLQTDYDSEELY